MRESSGFKLKKFRLILTTVLFIIGMSIMANASDTRYYGGFLDSGAKKVYSSLLSDFNKGTLTEDKRIVFYDLSETQLKDGYAAFLLDYPEAFYVQTFRYGYASVNGKICYRFLQPVYYTDAEKYITRTNAEVSKICALMAREKTVYDKIKVAHDYILNNTTFGTGYESGQSIIGGLLPEFGKKFVCSGHTRLFQLLCVKSNIPCVITSGNVNGKDHMWNYVQMDNQWYMVDVTFDHPFCGSTQIKTEKYFCLSSYTDKRTIKATYLGSTIITHCPKLSGKTICDIGNATIEDIPAQNYTGKAVTPKLKITYKSSSSSQIITLKEGTDYVLSYSGNINAGTATVTATGKGSCHGTIQKTFSIISSNITIKLNPNKGKVSRKSLTLSAGSASGELPVPTLKGYTFLGWYTSRDGGSLITSTTQIKKSQILFAHWKITQYSITYQLNGGKNSAKNPSTYNYKSSKIKLVSPTRKGYTFAGWYTDSEFKHKVSTIKKRSTGNITLYAKWTAAKK